MTDNILHFNPTLLRNKTPVSPDPNLDSDLKNSPSKQIQKILDFADGKINNFSSDEPLMSLPVGVAATVLLFGLYALTFLPLSF